MSKKIQRILTASIIALSLVIMPGIATAEEASSENEASRAGGIALDLNSHRVTINEQQVHVGPTEYRLLELLMRHPERAFERSQLLDRVWGRSVYVEERTVDVHVLRLRKILQPFGLQHFIQTVRGVGYRFSPA